MATAVLAMAMPGGSIAMQGHAAVCGVSPGQEAKSVLRDFDVRQAGVVSFVDPGSPDRKHAARRLFLRTRKQCEDLTRRDDKSDDIPDLIVDVMGSPVERVVAVAYRPVVRDCRQVRALFGPVLGPPAAGNAESAEWTLGHARARMLVTDTDGQCWIHLIRLGP